MYSAEASEKKIIYLAHENDYKRYFETARTGIIYLDRYMRVKLLNDEAERICNVHSAEVKGKKTEQAFGHLGERFVRLVSGKSHNDFHTSTLKIKLRDLYSYIQVTSFKIEEGTEVIGTVLIVQDLSAVRAAIKQIQTTQMLMSLGELAAGVAHHVRTPLTTISGYLQVMMGRLEDDRYTVKRDILEMMLDEVTYINNVVTELIMFAKPPIHKESGVSINRLLEEALLLTFKELGGENIEINKCITKDLPAINADANLLKQSFVNIMQNAIEAMPQEGVLSVKTWLHSELNMIVISITDTGSGVLPEILSRVFEPFYTTKLDRMGLGLPTAHRIISEHGGFINIISGEGSNEQGTKVNIYLPIIENRYKKLTVIHQQILNLQ